MITILHEPDYEILGNAQVYKADWLRLQARGAPRFVADVVSSNLVGRIGAFLLLGSAEGIHWPLHIEGWAWVLIVVGTYYDSAAAVYAIRAWVRMKQKFSD